MVPAWMTWIQQSRIPPWLSWPVLSVVILLGEAIGAISCMLYLDAKDWWSRRAWRRSYN